MGNRGTLRTPPPPPSEGSQTALQPDRPPTRSRRRDRVPDPDRAKRTRRKATCRLGRPWLGGVGLGPRRQPGVRPRTRRGRAMPTGTGGSGCRPPSWSRRERARGRGSRSLDGGLGKKAAKGRSPSPVEGRTRSCGRGCAPTKTEAEGRTSRRVGSRRVRRSRWRRGNGGKTGSIPVLQPLRLLLLLRRRWRSWQDVGAGSAVAETTGEEGTQG